MRMFAGWDRLGRDFTKEEFNNSYIKKNWGSKLSYEKYVEARLRTKLNEKRRANYAKRKSALKNKVYGYNLGNSEKQIKKLLGDIF